MKFLKFLSDRFVFKNVCVASDDKWLSYQFVETEFIEGFRGLIILFEIPIWGLCLEITVTVDDLLIRCVYPAQQNTCTFALWPNSLLCQLYPANLLNIIIFYCLKHCPKALQHNFIALCLRKSPQLYLAIKLIKNRIICRHFINYFSPLAPPIRSLAYFNWFSGSVWITIVDIFEIVLLFLIIEVD